MANNPLDFMKEALSAPLGELIASIGQGVGEAQAALDQGSLAQYMTIYDAENTDELVKLMRDIGYQPTFYTIPETEVEAQVSLSLSMEEKTSSNTSTANPFERSKMKVYAMPSNASTNNQYNINVNAFAKLKFKIVPIPTPEAIANLRVVPNVVGQSPEQAANILASIGLASVVVSSIAVGTISSQNPSAGTRVDIGSIVELTIQPLTITRGGKKMLEI
jgi:hypothetical protein